jgi:arginase
VGRSGGTELAPAAIRTFADGVWSADAGDLDVRVRGDERDPETGILGASDVLRSTEIVAGAVADALHAKGSPFLMGGDCSLLPGALGGARRTIGPLAVAYLDGHLDLYDGRTSPTGEAADMPMSVALGRGPAAWVAACGGPVLEARHAAILGYRDLEEALTHGHPHPNAIDGLTHVDARGIRERGAARVGEDISARAEIDPGHLWVHLDVDVLDQDVFPATDYLMPGGLDWTQLVDLLRPLLASPAFVGMSIGCYNPEKDPGEANGRALVGAFRDAFG